MFQVRFRDNAFPPYTLVGNITTIGRAAANMVVLPTSTVSELHAKIIQHENRLYLQDNKSAYGSFVNGTRVSYKELKLGDVLTVGNVHFEIIELDEKSLAATAAPGALRVPAPAAPESEWQLVSDSSWLSGKVFHLRKDSNMIGRGKDCDIVIPGTHLSRRHVEVRKEKGGLVVQDLASSNGTYLNEVRIQGSQPLRPGDRIRLDVYSFRVQGPGNTPLPASETQGPRKIDLSSTLQNIEALKSKEYQPKEWITKPTSHGNRYHEVPGKGHHNVLLAFSVVLGMGVLGIVAYIMMNLG
jgi:pSer/pThr/pTyr-binding forkhead associated (FHA) protein